MKRIFLLVLLFSILFSGCDGISGMENGFFSFGGSSSHSNSGKEIDNTGSGLDVNFNINTENIKTGRLMYEVSIENSGREPIELTRSNLELEYGVYEKESIIDETTAELFYEKVLGEDGKVKLYQDMEFEQGGVLRVGDKILQSKTVNNFDLGLRITYPYKTEFVTNLDLGVKYGMHEIKGGSSFEQATPIQVNNLKLVPDYEDKHYILEVEINDRGDRGDVLEYSDSGIELTNFDLKFGDDDISSSCTVKPDSVGSVKSDKMVVKSRKSLTLECPVVISSEDPFITQVSGSFDYTYMNFNKVSVTVPRDVRDVALPE